MKEALEYQCQLTYRINNNVRFRTVCSLLPLLYHSHQSHTYFTDTVSSLWPTKLLMVSIPYITTQHKYHVLCIYI